MTLTVVLGGEHHSWRLNAHEDIDALREKLDHAVVNGGRVLFETAQGEVVTLSGAHVAAYWLSARSKAAGF